MARTYPITIESATTIPNELNEGIQTWRTFARTRAEIIPQTGKEIIRATQPVEIAQTLFRLRYLDGVNAGMRIRFNNRLFNITSTVNVKEANEKLELVCQESK